MVSEIPWLVQVARNFFDEFSINYTQLECGPFCVWFWPTTLQVWTGVQLYIRTGLQCIIFCNSSWWNYSGQIRTHAQHLLNLPHNQLFSCSLNHNNPLIRIHTVVLWMTTAKGYIPTFLAKKQQICKPIENTWEILHVQVETNYWLIV